jgi:hypothetical protein
VLATGDIVALEMGDALAVAVDDASVVRVGVGDIEGPSATPLRAPVMAADRTAPIVTPPRTTAAATATRSGDAVIHDHAPAAELRTTGVHGMFLVNAAAG